MAQCNCISGRCQSKKWVGRRSIEDAGRNGRSRHVGNPTPGETATLRPFMRSRTLKGTVGTAVFMQVLIRKTGTTLYWSADGRWTASREQASDLREVCRAVLICLRCGWTDAELVIRFEKTSGEMTVPVTSLPGRRTLRHSRRSRREALCRGLSRLASILPFRRRRVSFGCRRNLGPGGWGRR